MVFGAIVTFASFFVLMMSFCSPYWIESYEETRASFKNMGLWQYCFKDFVYPKYAFLKQFTGCHNIFSHVSTANWPVLILVLIFSHSYRSITLSVSICCPAGSWRCRAS